MPRSPPLSPSPPPLPPLHARNLTSILLPSPPFPSVSITSILAAPYLHSPSLALFLSDSSALLYPSLSPRLSPTQTIQIPSPTLPSLSIFSLLFPSSTLLFLSFSPSPPLAFALAPNSPRFTPIQLSFKPGLFNSLNPPLIRLASTNNIIALHSIPTSEVWLLYLELKDHGEGSSIVEIKKCAVIEITIPICTMSVGLGFLVLGESGGVRVFPLRPLVKGKEFKRCEKKGKIVLNGLVDPLNKTDHGDRDSCKLRTAKVKQNSGDFSSFFVKFGDTIYSEKSGNGIRNPKPVLKAVLVHPFSKKVFLILDSSGDLHVFSLHSSTMGPIISGDSHTNRLEIAMKVKLLAVLPNINAKVQIFWVSDGGQLVNMVSAYETESIESDEGERKLTPVEISATETIFTSETIQDIVPLSVNSVLILCQGNIFAYGTS